jgi:hypothetical protein
LKREIKNKLGATTFNEIATYVRRRAPNLWGGNQPDNHLDNMLVFTLTKFVLGWSYGKMIKLIRTEPRLNYKSLEHNVLKISRVLRDWGSEQISWGTRHEWEEAARGARVPPEFGNVLMWIDSSDFKIIHKDGINKNSEWWSGKEGRPCRRYMFLSTADGLIRKIWPAYGPKKYDSDKVRDHRDFFDTHLKDVVVIGDNHFLAAKEYLRYCKILAPTAAVDPPKRKADRAPGTIGEKQIARNKKIRKLRARVERPFATLANRVESLNTPFYENMHVQDDVVTFAAGVHNFVTEQRN